MKMLLGFKADQIVYIALALERLQARAAVSIPDLDGLVMRRRRQPCRVVREGH